MNAQNPAHPNVPLSLIVGLGNPGVSYEGTRHNVGFSFLDHWIQKRGGLWRSESKFHAEITSVCVGIHKVFCCKPQTFMNQSGVAVQAFCAYYQIEPAAVLVVCDDISIPFGQFKVSTIPGTAGHNGVKSIASQVGSGFIRYRVGLGTKPPYMQLDDYVLSRFTEAEQQQLPALAEVFEKNLEVFIDKGVQKGLNHIKRYTHEYEQK